MAEHNYSLNEGETYTFNFAGCPSGVGRYYGTVDVGGTPWLVFDVKGKDDYETKYFNPALLVALRPWEDPRG